MKCIKGYLVLYQRLKQFSLYTFHQEGVTNCELDDFIETFNTPEHLESLQRITAALREFAKRGIDKKKFRPKGEGPVDALLAGPDNLRLYVIPCSRYSLIVGNGCRKDVRRLQESEDCRCAWELMVALDHELQLRLLDKSIQWQPGYDGETAYEELTGDMYFELGDC